MNIKRLFSIYIHNALSGSILFLRIPSGKPRTTNERDIVPINFLRYKDFCFLSYASLAVDCLWYALNGLKSDWSG